MQVIADNDISKFIKAIEGHKYELVYYVDLFTGMRQGEILGLTWDCVDFEKGILTINKQLTRDRFSLEYGFAPLKNDKIRKIAPANTVMNKLKEHLAEQEEQKIKLGSAWQNKDGLVFTNEIGRYLSNATVYKYYKKIVKDLGIPNLRFHDLRHSYAVTAIQSGDDIKTVQENLGHHTAAFTLDIYGHVTDTMKKASADRMEQFINGINVG